MIDALIRFSLRQRAAVLLLAALLMAVGAYVARAMPVDVFPDLTAPTVSVITEARGMAPTEVEAQVTFPIESALNGAAGVRRVRSATAVGISVVWVEFDWGTDIALARQTVAERLALAAAALPDGIERPALAPTSSIMGEILFLAITSDRHDMATVRTTAETAVRRRLLAVPGVSQVTPIGGDVKQYQVVVAPARLRAYGVSLADVAGALRASNENVSAGFLPEGGQELLITGLGRFQSLEDIAATVVAARPGAPVRVADVAHVQTGAAPKRGEGSANARPAVILGVQKQPGANTLVLTAALDEVLDDIAARLPEGMAIDRDVFRQAGFIATAVRNVELALRDGALLVVLVVVLFLGNLRATLVTLTAIPLSLVAAVLVLSGLGATINTMTLGGMAIAVGALVDDAIIDVENVFRRLRENGAAPPAARRPALDVVLSASVEIRGSIVFATLIIVLVFLPVFFLPGVEGRLLRPLGVAYVVALGASLLVAVTVTPALCALLLPRSKAVQDGREPRVVSWLRRRYAPLLRAVLGRPWHVATPALLAFVIAAAGATRLGRAFLPEFNEGALTISAVTLPGTSLQESDALGRMVEHALLDQPEVTSVARRTGRAELDEHAQGVEAAELDVSFSLKDRTKDELLAGLRAALSTVPGVSVTIGQPISHRIDHMLSGTRANVAVKLFGDDLYRLRALAERARAAMSGVRGVVDLSVEQQADVPTLLVRMDRPAMARHGLRVEDVGHALEASLQGLPVTRLLEGRASYDVVVRVTAESGAWRSDTLGDLPLDAPSGAKVPLRAVAALTPSTGPNLISREDVERKFVVMCNVSGRDVASVVDDVRALVDPIVAGATGYRVEYGGQFEAAEDAGRLLALLGLAVVLGIGLVLHLALGSARDALLVMLNLPLALIGGVAAVWLTGGVLSVASLIGFITVFGIAARNGIMLVTHVRHLQLEEGVTSLHEAVERGAHERVAPILMTALSAGLALVPLALAAHEPGNEIQSPMAVVILGGLFTSTALNMLVVPAIYLRLGRPAAAPAPRGDA
ncbi:MAG: efflux RND transporter permease subunit [Planctomycetes bacterium]|nr:efflux RND transporter permease subunit [Planctomycetota bacterium]